MTSSPKFTENVSTLLLTLRHKLRTFLQKVTAIATLTYLILVAYHMKMGNGSGLNILISFPHRVPFLILQ